MAGAVAIAVGTVVSLEHDGRPGTEMAVPVGTDPAGAARMLHALVDALADGDVEAAQGLAPPGDAATEELLTELVRNVDRLDLTDLSARYVGEIGSDEPDGSWTAAVDLTWRLAGFDEGLTHTEVLATFVGEPGGVRLVGFGGVDTSVRRGSPLWLRGPVSVVRTPESLVLTRGDPALARGISRRALRGIAVVGRVLPRWEPTVVVEVPASAAELDEALGAEPGTHADIGAVTAAADGSGRAESPRHVFVNPEVYAASRSDGAQVLMSHEITHVATQGAASDPDAWLLEGFADYVALRDVAGPDATTLRRAAALVGRDGVPDRLPGSRAFDATGDDLEAAYEQAWLACRLVVEEFGESALVRVHRAAREGAGTREALRRAGLPPGRLVRMWQERLQDLTG